MTEVTIYTKFYCPYCARAKALLDRRGVAYHEICLLYTSDAADE